MIKKCNCAHKKQDDLHGEGMRVYNKSASLKPQAKCTVCNAIKSTG